MELRHLRYFTAAAGEQNITRAAARLHVSQPSLSRQIRDLEHELGITLFEHGAKSVRLTDAGRIFLTEAQAVLSRAREAVDVARAFASGERGEIHVGFAPSLTVEILPRTLRLFQETNPGVRIRLHDLSTQEMIDGLRQGDLHVALMIQSSSKSMSGLTFEKLREFPVCLAAHPSHPLATCRKVNLKILAGERLIAYSASEYPEYHAWLIGLFARSKQQPEVAEQHDSSTSLIASVEAGRGVALVQQGFECLAGPRLIVRPLQPAPAPFVVGVAHHKQPTAKAVQNFISVARAAGGTATAARSA